MKLLDELPGCYPDSSSRSYYFIGSIKIFLDYNIHILDYHNKLDKLIVDKGDKLKITYLKTNQIRYVPYKKQDIPECKLKTIMDLVKLIIYFDEIEVNEVEDDLRRINLSHVKIEYNY